jgi:hydroxylamine reductase (hybrid-cluster protein)
MTDPILIFMAAADDAAAYPVSRFIGMTVAANATIKMQFESSIGSGGTDGASSDILALTVTADTELVVFKALAEAIEGAKRNMKNKGFLLIADDVTSTYIHPNITAVALTIDS